MILSGLLVGCLIQTRTVELSRGALVSGGGRYWSVSDTYLDEKNPTANFGGQGLVLGGEHKTVLIRFGDLDQVVGRGWKVTDATLEFTVSGGKPKAPVSVQVVKHEWGEGAMNTMASVMAAMGKPVQATKGAACWKEAQFGNANSLWNGASDGEPVKFDASKSTEAIVSIGGLGEAVERFAQRPYENFGFALAFDSDMELLTCQSQAFRPSLKLTLAPVTPPAGPDLAVMSVRKLDSGDIEASVGNTGVGGSGAAKGSWFVQGKVAGTVDIPAMAAGERKSFSLKNTLRPERADHRHQVIDFIVDPASDSNPQNNAGRYFVGGIDVGIGGESVAEVGVKSAVDFLNSIALPYSRFSFAPEGSLERFNFVGSGGISVSASGSPRKEIAKAILAAAGLRVESPAVAGHAADDPFGGITGVGDTRDETIFPEKLTLVPIPHLPAEEATGLLSLNEVATLNAKASGANLQAPKVVMIRTKNRGGEELAKLTLDFYSPTDPTKSVKTITVDNTSSFLLPSELKKGNWLVKGSMYGATAWTWLKEWQLMDLASRGNTSVGILDMRLNLPTTPLDTGDVAKDRPMKDSNGTDLSKLTTDGNTESVKLPEKAGDWIEVDLRRDRTLGEIILKSGDQPMWSQFEIRIYGTGDGPAASFVWGTESDFGWSVNNLGDGKQVAYRGPIVRVRFIRIVNRLGGPGTLSRLQVTPVKNAFGGGIP